MRCGKYWDASLIDDATKDRIERIITGEYDRNIAAKVREKAINLSDIFCFKKLPLWLACYVVYNRHSENKEIAKWETPEDIDAYLVSFKQQFSSARLPQLRASSPYRAKRTALARSSRHI